MWCNGVRRGSRRYRKYAAKTKPEDTFRLLQLTRNLALEGERAYQPQHEEIIRRVKAIIGNYGSESVRQHAYVWFAQGVWYAKQKYSSLALQKEVNALFMYFYVLGLNESALRDIAASFGVTIPPIYDIVGVTPMSEDMIYAGTRRALKEELRVVSLFIDNGLDKEVLVQVKANRESSYTKATNVEYPISVAANSFTAQTLSPDTFGWLPYIMVEVYCYDAPTSGSLTIWLVRNKDDQVKLVDALEIRDTDTHTPETDPDKIFIREW